MTQPSRFDRMATLALVLCAVVVAAMTVLRTFGRKPDRERVPPPVRLSTALWERVRSEGEQLGDSLGGVHIVIFSDFECPFCRDWALRVLPELRSRHPGAFRVTFRHWPLPQHRLAPSAAKASLCADSQGYFESFHDLLFGKQDSIGLISFAEFANRAQIPDQGRFEACLRDSSQRARMVADSVLVHALSGQGTPLVVVDGTLFPRAPTPMQLDSSIQRARRAREVAK